MNYDDRFVFIHSIYNSTIFMVISLDVWRVSQEQKIMAAHASIEIITAIIEFYLQRIPLK